MVLTHLFLSGGTDDVMEWGVGQYKVIIQSCYSHILYLGIMIAKGNTILQSSWLQ